MVKFRVRRITVQGFRSFSERQSSPELPQHGLVAIRGFNRNSTGSSGAGKSSVALAIAYAFGFLPFDANKQQSWLTKTPMQVELELDTPTGPAVIRRGKEFSLTWNGQTLKGSAKDVEAGIRKLTGLPTELLAALTYRQQQRRGRFLSMTDAEKKEFLSTLLGLVDFDTQIAESIKKSNALAAQADTTTQVTDAIEARLVEPVQPPDITGIQAEYEATTASLAAAKSVLEQGRTAYAAIEVQGQRERSELDAQKRASLTAPPQNNLQLLYRRQEEWKAVLKAAEDKANQERLALKTAYNELHQKLDLLKRAASVKASASQLLAEAEVAIEKLKSNTCPTCEREWIQNQALLGQKQAAVAFAQMQLQEAVKAESQIPDLEESKRSIWEQLSKPLESEDIKHHREQLNAIATDIATEKANTEAVLQTAKASWAEKELALNKSLSEKIRPLREFIDAATSTVTATQHRLTLLHSQIESGKRLKEGYVQALERYLGDRQHVQKQRSEIEGLRRLSAEEADYAAALKAFLGSIFDEVLVEITNATNDLLKSVPNVSTTTVNFTSEAVTAKGSVKQEIRPVVRKGGAVVDINSGLSGGQLTAVELAVDLSVADVIGRRTGCKPGFMIFDESFDGHCLPVKEACVEVLAKAAKDSLILIVDHASEMSEYFTSFIDVEAVDDVSRFM
jgi:DNA repair exonuclease SbcCD ATPase subunit